MNFKIYTLALDFLYIVENIINKYPLNYKMAIISNKSENTTNLDLYDKKIIYYLSQDSRIPVTELSKKLKLSQQRTQYKIERLKREILEPAAFMNFSLLDISSYIIYVEKLSDETVEKLLKSDSIYFFMQTMGKYRWVLNVVTNDINSFCKKYIPDDYIEINPIVNAIPDDYNPFNLKIQPIPLKKNKKLQLNTKDYMLLSYLAKQPIDSILKISNETKIDRKTIRDRIKLYKETNLIQKFRYGINIFKIGHLIYTLKMQTTAKNKKLILEHIRKNIFSGFVFESYNNFTMHYLPPSHKELLEFIKELESIEQDIKIDVLQNTEFFKVDLVPEIVTKILKEKIKET